MARAYKKSDIAIDNSELVEIRKEMNTYARKDVLKVLSKFHREIAKEQMKEARTLGRRQRVPKASRSVMGITASGTRTGAKVNLKTNDRYPSTLSMEFGRRLAYVPTKSGKTRAISRSQIGKLPYSRPGAQFEYKPWIGNQSDRGDSSFYQLGKGGYVVSKTIAKNQNEILETYNDRMYDALVKAIK
jgi:C4-dicarboxylate-specific signal transduction histidine kinase|tara:strand:- start:3 stop:563 length:561 start_codon:yes stop_codon:yes gene_type:complete